MRMYIKQWSVVGKIGSKDLKIQIHNLLRGSRSFYQM